MPSRRGFLTGLAAAGLHPLQGWAAAGAPDFLSAARFPDDSYRLVGLTRLGEMLFDLPLPDRGHAAAAHPTRAIAVGFARRPGDFAVVIDCITGQEITRLSAPSGRHFYGHGVFSRDGRRLFTTENDYEAAEGMIGVWDSDSFARIGEFPSGGVGPHDMALLPDGQTLVVANGGIETHPDAGRAKLNIPVMMPNLTYLRSDGQVLGQIELAPELHKNSIRHLAVAADGAVGFAMQWQGASDVTVPLLGRHSRADAPLLMMPEAADLTAMQGYAGSIAICNRAAQIAITSPRGGLIQIHDLKSGALVQQITEPDVCGIGALPDGFLFTSGAGVIGAIVEGKQQVLAQHDCRFDNHLIALT
ncbi:MAG: DUF1513 domain-containing protein [Pelagimonas sp.]|jgi:hypothetical protein|nr:DUF1513 domain-containing protein [Pelagimonas sp.]